MKAIDFDATVEFVWNWVAQLQAHMSTHGWSYTNDNGVEKRGTTSNTRREIASHLFEKIVHSDTPDIVMKALSVQIAVLTDNSCKYNIPNAYLLVNQERGQALWNVNRFCTALDEDLDQLMETYGYCQVLGQQHMSASDKHKKM